MKIKLDPGAKMPTRAHPTDAGLDLYAKETVVFWSGRGTAVDTGVHIAFDPGTYGKIESKSGLNVKHGLVSCGGVIDEGYTGSIVVKLYNLGETSVTIKAGEKIAQLVVMPYLTPPMELVDDLDETERGDAGFGSTGK